MHYKNKIILLNLLIIIYNFILVIFNNRIHKYFEDDLTLVSAYYPIKSKHSKSEYLSWIQNVLLLNK